jgi:hypothetical protein
MTVTVWYANVVPAGRLKALIKKALFSNRPTAI